MCKIKECKTKELVGSYELSIYRQSAHKCKIHLKQRSLPYN